MTYSHTSNVIISTITKQGVRKVVVTPRSLPRVDKELISKYLKESVGLIAFDTETVGVSGGYDQLSKDSSTETTIIRKDDKRCQ